MFQIVLSLQKLKQLARRYVTLGQKKKLGGLEFIWTMLITKYTGCLLLVLVDSYSAWPEIIRVPNGKASTVKLVLQTYLPAMEYQTPSYPTMLLNFTMMNCAHGCGKSVVNH